MVGRRRKFCVLDWLKRLNQHYFEQLIKNIRLTPTKKEKIFLVQCFLFPD